jgi:hypothetical protein
MLCSCIFYFLWKLYIISKWRHSHIETKMKIQALCLFELFCSLSFNIKKCTTLENQFWNDIQFLVSEFSCSCIHSLVLLEVLKIIKMWSSLILLLVFKHNGTVWIEIISKSIDKGFTDVQLIAEWLMCYCLISNWRSLKFTHVATSPVDADEGLQTFGLCWALTGFV